MALVTPAHTRNEVDAAGPILATSDLSIGDEWDRALAIVGNLAQLACASVAGAAHDTDRQGQEGGRRCHYRPTVEAAHLDSGEIATIPPPHPF